MINKIIIFTILFILPFSALAITPNDTFFDNQWYLNQIQAGDAWDIEQGSSEVVIAIIDTAMDITHPDLDGNIWKNEDEIPGNGIDDDNNDYIDDVNGWDFVYDDNDPSPDFHGSYVEDGISHGTATASIAAAEGNNKNGITGLSWHSKIMPLKVMDGTGTGYSEYVAKAIYYAIDNGADVINLSFMGFRWSDDMNTAVKRAWEAGIVVVAASGNTPDYIGGTDLNEFDEYPACIDQYEDDQWVLGVSATDTLDQKALFSNYGSMCIDISAPGMDMFSARTYRPEYPGFDVFYNDDWSGTSFSTPVVSGVAALIKSLNPGLSAPEINHILIASGDDIDGVNPNYEGELGKRLNAYKALVMSQLLAENGSVVTIGSPKNSKPLVYKLGRNGDVKNSFSAYENYYLGFDAEIGDLNGNGFHEILIGAGRGGGPQVRIFTESGRLLGQFFAYDERFRGGVYVALGDINGDGSQEIITSPGAGGGPHILVYDDHAEIRGNFMAYDPEYRGGVKLAAGDIDADDSDEIITAFYVDNKLNIRTFRRSGTLVSEFVRDGVSGEVLIDAHDVNLDGADEILLAYKKGSEVFVNILDKNGQSIDQITFESRGTLFDVKGFYDYIVGKPRIVVITDAGDYFEANYYNELFELFKSVKIEL